MYKVYMELRVPARGVETLFYDMVFVALPPVPQPSACVGHDRANLAGRGRMDRVLREGHRCLPVSRETYRLEMDALRAQPPAGGAYVLIVHARAKSVKGLTQKCRRRAPALSC